MAQPFVLSRKVRSSIFEGIELLRFSPFTERDVKTLLVDLRELAKYMAKALASETNDLTNLMAEFIEVCDFIAHASRDRGLIERMVREHARTLHSSVSLTPDAFAKVPVAGVLNANRFVLALAAVSAFALGNLDTKRRQTYVKELLERQSEIELCVLSLLQDSFIGLKEGEGFGVLQLMPYEGKYRVYCRVMHSKIEQEARTRTAGDGKLALVFPVMVSGAECVDPDILTCDHVVFPQPIFETFRDENLRLQVRVVEIGGDA